MARGLIDPHLLREFGQQWLDIDDNLAKCGTHRPSDVEETSQRSQVRVRRGRHSDSEGKRLSPS